jgi:hypothetical protein
MTRNNFQYEKRQRELEKKRKAEEKARRRLEAKQNPAAQGQEPNQDEPLLTEPPQTEDTA